MKHQLLILFCLIVIISAKAQDTYYWVGGQGEWNDLNNWNNENGQVPNEIPNATIDVYFNSNSFNQEGDTVFLNSTNFVCKSMIWENIPFDVVLFSDNPGSEMEVFGSL